MENKGKAYAHKSGQRQGDLYHTPKSLVWSAYSIIKREFTEKSILEPCAGAGAISEELRKYNYFVTSTDLHVENESNINLDYLHNTFTCSNQIITNPPFSLWDEFVLKAKTHCKKFMFIGRLNYFGTQSRLEKGIWNNLKGIYPFSRYVDYQTPYRKDGHFHVGAMATAWFLWDMEHTGNIDFKILDVQKYATLGNFK